MTASGQWTARRLGIASLICAAAVIPMYLIAWGIGTALMGLLDVAEGDTLYSAGAAGWIAALILIGLLVAPQVVGLVLGLRARSAGAGGIAIVGIATNGVIGVYLLATGVVGLLGA